MENRLIVEKCDEKRAAKNRKAFVKSDFLNKIVSDAELPRRSINIHIY
jgi:hypothetical protein